MIILGSVRDGAPIGQPIAEWVRRAAEADGRFEIDFADLREVALPLMDEPNHPRLRQYTKPHTLAWSERVDRADAYLFVFPEYNHSYSPAIKNAIDYLAQEWNRKPVGFVNWGGSSSGTRAQVALKTVVACLGMVITKGNIELHMPQGQLTESGAFEPSEQQSAAFAAQLDELLALDEALRPLRG